MLLLLMLLLLMLFVMLLRGGLFTLTGVDGVDDDAVFGDVSVVKHFFHLGLFEELLGPLTRKGRDADGRRRRRRILDARHAARTTRPPEGRGGSEAANGESVVVDCFGASEAGRRLIVLGDEGWRGASYGPPGLQRRIQAEVHALWKWFARRRRTPRSSVGRKLSLRRRRDFALRRQRMHQLVQLEMIHRLRRGLSRKGDRRLSAIERQAGFAVGGRKDVVIRMIFLVPVIRVAGS